MIPAHTHLRANKLTPERVKHTLHPHPPFYTLLLPGAYLGGTEMYAQSTCVGMRMAALFMTANTGDKPRRPPSGEWINKLWYARTMKYESAIKKKLDT